MTAGRYNIAIEQGATFSLPLEYQDSTGAAVDLTTYTARMQVRKTPASPVILELTTENDRITLGGTEGTIDLLVTAEDTAALPAGDFLYDLELVSGASVTRLIEGQCTIRAEVTK